MKNKKFSIIGAIIALVFLISFPVTAQQDGEHEILVGFAGPLSGDLAQFGVSGLSALKLLEEETNRKGGVLGRELRFIFEDDRCSPDIAASVADKLIFDDVIGVIGHYCSAATLAAVDIYKEAEIIVISPASASRFLTNEGRYPNFFRTIHCETAEMERMYSFLVNELGYSSLAVVYSGDWGWQQKEIFQEIKAASDSAGKIDVKMVDASREVMQVYIDIVDSGAEGAIFFGTPEEGAEIVRSLREYSITIPFVFGEASMGEGFIGIIGENTESIYATAPADPKGNRLAAELEKKFWENLGYAPGPFAFEVYAAGQALLSAVERAGNVDYGAVRKALQENTVETPLGAISFDMKGELRRYDYRIYQLRGGRFELF